MDYQKLQIMYEKQTNSFNAEHTSNQQPTRTTFKIRTTVGTVPTANECRVAELKNRTCNYLTGCVVARLTAQQLYMQCTFLSYPQLACSAIAGGVKNIGHLVRSEIGTVSSR